MADPLAYLGTPRWVKISGIIVIGLVLLVIISIFSGVGGSHGPGRHMSRSDAPSRAADGSAVPEDVDQ